MDLKDNIKNSDFMSNNCIYNLAPNPKRNGSKVWNKYNQLNNGMKLSDIIGKKIYTRGELIYDHSKNFFTIQECKKKSHTSPQSPKPPSPHEQPPHQSPEYDEKSMFNQLFSRVQPDGLFRNYTNNTGKSNKFWRIGFSGLTSNVLSTQYGRIGTDGSTKFHDKLGSIDESINHGNTLIKQKLEKGYVPSTLLDAEGNTIYNVEGNKLSPQKHLPEKIKITRKKKQTKKESKAEKTLSQTKKKSSPKTIFDRAAKIDELKSICTDDYDGITYESISDWDDEDLEDVVLIGPDGHKRCYIFENIYKWYSQLLSEGKSPRDPINPDHIITENEAAFMKKIMTKRAQKKGEKYESPKLKKIELDENAVQFIIQDPPKYYRPRRSTVPNARNYLHTEYPFYEIYINITNRSGITRKIHVGYVPAGIDSHHTGDSYTSSYSIVGNLRKLWEIRKLLTVHNPASSVQCCTIDIIKTIDEWYNSDGTINMDKFKKLSADIIYQEYM
tara:strand:+ start:4735 stop:6231 length:1497 start_codon:yes stop_codon:yes gene_type:complete